MISFRKPLISDKIVTNNFYYCFLSSTQYSKGLNYTLIILTFPTTDLA